MRIGILGGTFNPPHIGHLILAKEVQEKLALDKIFFIPTNLPPHKEPQLPAVSHRFNMVKCATESNSLFEVLDIEIKRGGTSYTIDTANELKEKFSKADFYLIVGSDLANTFSTWKNFTQVKKLIKIVVAQRKDFPLQEKDEFILVDITQISISSSRIREMVKQGLSIKYLVNEGVERYIEKHKLYKE
ncbi:MAG: nicotinate-nucleotide adenylyltransferase [Candidatus Omnitrophota bacterium]|nr:MAG: nicotinate-nucleotide adenylyltransferase [Candidatus Omnitrophota bacterium]